MSKPTGKLIRQTAGNVGAVPTTRKVNNKALSADITLNATDVGAVPTTRKVNTKVLSADITLNAADVGAVPTTRKVNTKVLSADITLNAADVGAVPTTRKVNTKVLSTDITLNAADVGAVPTTRKVNTKVLSADITLNAADVGAYTRSEVDNKIAAAAGIGYGQDWIDVKSERKYGVIYTNTTSKPIFISVFTNADSTLTVDVRKNSAAPWVTVGADSARGAVPNNFIVPVNYQYRVNSYFGYWAELR
nr:hypothetical protein [Providencia rettgeri]